MKKSITIITTILFLLLLIVSCDSSTASKETEIIRGKVVDEDGSSISDAKIAVSLYTTVFDTTNQIIDSIQTEHKSLPFNDTIGFFNIISGTHFKLWVKNNRNQNAEKVLLDTIMTSGWHQVPWDLKNSEGKYVKNGSYNYILEIDTLTHTKKMFTTHAYDHVAEDDIVYYTHTDNKGNFQINKHDFIINDSLEYWVKRDSLGTMKFSGYIKVWAIKNENTNATNSFADSISINPNQESDDFQIMIPLTTEK